MPPSVAKATDFLLSLAGAAVSGVVGLEFGDDGVPCLGLVEAGVADLGGDSAGFCVEFWFDA